MYDSQPHGLTSTTAIRDKACLTDCSRFNHLPEDARCLMWKGCPWLKCMKCIWRLLHCVGPRATSYHTQTCIQFCHWHISFDVNLVAMKKKTSPRIPEPSGQYQITHLLLRHVLFFTSEGLQLVWQGVFMKRQHSRVHSGMTPAHDKGRFLLLLAEIRELVGPRASGKQFTKDNCDGDCQV